MRDSFSGESFLGVTLGFALWLGALGLYLADVGFSDPFASPTGSAPWVSIVSKTDNGDILPVSANDVTLLEPLFEKAFVIRVLHAELVGQRGRRRSVTVGEISEPALRNYVGTSGRALGENEVWFAGARGIEGSPVAVRDQVYRDGGAAPLGLRRLAPRVDLWRLGPGAAEVTARALLEARPEPAMGLEWYFFGVPKNEDQLELDLHFVSQDRLTSFVAGDSIYSAGDSGSFVAYSGITAQPEIRGEVRSASVVLLALSVLLLFIAGDALALWWLAKLNQQRPSLVVRNFLGASLWYQWMYLVSSCKGLIMAAASTLIVLVLYGEYLVYFRLPNAFLEYVDSADWAAADLDVLAAASGVLVAGAFAVVVAWECNAVSNYGAPRRYMSVQGVRPIPFRRWAYQLSSSALMCAVVVASGSTLYQSMHSSRGFSGEGVLFVGAEEPSTIEGLREKVKRWGNSAGVGTVGLPFHLITDVPEIRIYAVSGPGVELKKPVSGNTLFADSAALENMGILDGRKLESDNDAWVVLVRSFAKGLGLTDAAIGRPIYLTLFPGLSETFRVTLKGIVPDIKMTDTGGSDFQVMLALDNEHIDVEGQSLVLTKEVYNQSEEILRSESVRISSIGDVLLRLRSNRQSFAMISLLLCFAVGVIAAVGLYTTIKMDLYQRYREYAIRLALGSTASKVALYRMREWVGAALIGVFFTLLVGVCVLNVYPVDLESLAAGFMVSLVFAVGFVLLGAWLAFKSVEGIERGKEGWRRAIGQ